jgi:hypothetical protein
VKDEVLDAYVRSLVKSAEYINKYVNPVELKALIRRFMTLNPHLDPKVVDWVGVWDDKLTYSEQIENFRHHYPHFRWSEETITEESFEDSRKKALWEIVRTLDEQSLRELAQLIEKELGGLSQAQTEQKKEPAIQTPTITSTLTIPSAQQPAEPKITLKVLAGVPVLLEARAFASAFSVEELCDDRWVLWKARGRINASIASDEYVWPFGDPLQDLLSFHLAVVILSQIPDRRIWERWAETERQRAERFMNAAVDDGVLEAIWKDLLIRATRSGPDEEERTGLPYKIHVTDYLRLVKGIDGAEWRLENRTVWRGWVYVTRRELVRLISEEVKARILRRLEEVKVDRVPEPIKETAEKIRTTLAIRFARANDKQTSQTHT